MKVRSPITFHNKAGNIVALGDVVDDSELKSYGWPVPFTPYETKVVRDEPADAPRAVTTESIKPAKPAKKAAKKAR